MLILPLLLACLALAPALARDRPPRLTVKDGVLLNHGKPFRALGLNVVPLADEILAKGEAASETFAAIRRLGQKRVPFVRFWASHFDSWKAYREDPRRYWRHMDLLIDACEKAGFGLAPTLFWSAWNIPFDFGEFRYAWLDEESRTRRFMEQYVREFVTRYRGRDAIWFWEFANESNLLWDLPNAMAHLPEGHKDNRNVVRSYGGTLAVRAFAREVRKYDGRRPISSGDSSPRPSQFRIATAPLKPGESWGEDTPEQAAAAMEWTVPSPVDLLSVHYYASPAAYDPRAVRESLQTFRQWAERMRRPLFLGEFGVLDQWTRVPPDFDEAAYQRSMRDFFDAIYESGTPLAAYWAYSIRGRRNIGAIGPEGSRFEYILDLIEEYNRKVR